MSAVAKPALSKSGLRKAAILLLNLEHRQSAELLRRLSDNQVEAIGQCIAELGEIGNEETESVLLEFLARAGHGDGGVRGGWSRARKLLVNALGDAAGNRISAAIPLGSRGEIRPFAAIESADPAFLAELLTSENTQTIAVILAHVSPDCSSKVLKHLEADLRDEVVLRMACLESVSPNVVARMAGILERKLAALGAEKTTAAGGPQVVADLLNRVAPDVAERILASMDERDQETAGRIRDLLFVFEDLKNVDIEGIRELVKRIDRKVFTMALKGVSEELTTYICESMSKRGAEMLREDMEAMGPVKIKDVEAAQKEILQIARAMEAEGVLSLSASDANEYVQ